MVGEDNTIDEYKVSNVEEEKMSEEEGKET
jgi:hypothetical protein